MKTKFFLPLFALLTTMTLVAQPPLQFKYQGIVRDNSGIPMIDKNISLRISMLQGSEAGTAVYIEKHITKTNQFGLFNINVGAGDSILGEFSEIQWSNNNYFQKVELDTTAENKFTFMGTSQILSVPYALAADVSNYTLNNGYANMWVFDKPGKYNFNIISGGGNYMIEVWGGGGGGSIEIVPVDNSYYINFFSGGGGGYAKSIYNFKKGVEFQVLVGAGGIGGFKDSTTIIFDRNDGGDSGILNGSEILLRADGGQGGNRCRSVMLGGNSYGQFNIKGGDGYSDEYSYGGFTAQHGGVNGGNSPNGGEGGQFTSNGNEPGGGGSADQYKAGNGANGRVVIYGQGNIIIQKNISDY